MLMAMLNGDTIYWLCWLATIVFFGAMIYIAWAAIFKDRPKGKRRCPKCWFDMCATPGMTCGECGFTAHFEKQLNKRRRRLGVAVLAILSCVAMAGVINERLMVRGWMGIVPTKALILSLPFTMDLQGKSFLELTKRMQASELSDGEWKMLMKRCAKGDFQREVFSAEWDNTYSRVILSWRQTLEAGSDAEKPLWDIAPKVEVTTRDSWPTDVSPRLEIQINDWWPTNTTIRIRAQPRIEGEPSTTFYKSNTRFRTPAYQLSIRALPEGVTDVVVDLVVQRKRPEIPEDDSATTNLIALNEWEPVGTYSFTVPVKTQGKLSDMLIPSESVFLDNAMRQALSGSVTKWSKGRSPVRVRIDAQRTRNALPEEAAIGAIVELLYDGQVARRLDLWWTTGSNRFNWEVVYEDEPLLRTATNQNNKWKMRVRGDAELALRVGDATTYWDGEFTIPMRVRNAQQKNAPPRPYWHDDPVVTFDNAVDDTDEDVADG